MIMLNTSINTPATATAYEDIRKALLAGYDPSSTSPQYPREVERSKVLYLLDPSIEEGTKMKSCHLKLLQSTIYEIGEASKRNKEENKPSTLHRDVIGCLNFIKAYGKTE
jgi:hypothetical protein